jgi:hypothetical protein
MPTRATFVVITTLLASSLVSCDALQGLIEPQWTVEETNGDNGAFHFGMAPNDLHIGLREHFRIERIEKRTIKKPGGATQEQERDRKVRVLTARCESKSVCDAEPHDSDSREIVITPKMMGMTKVYVSASVDEGEVFKDSITVRVQ